MARFGLGKNFSWDERVLILVKFFKNNISTWVKIVTEEQIHQYFIFSCPLFLCHFNHHIMTLQKRSAWNYKIQSHIKSEEHTHLKWCEQLIKHKFSQCVPANLETSCLLEIHDISWKLQLRHRYQFLWCALALTTSHVQRRLILTSGQPPQLYVCWLVHHGPY
jgi:hypothetical protein